EFGGRMIEADRRALALAGGKDAVVAIIPAAAAPDENHHHAGRNGVEWFEGIGANNVTSLSVIDHASAQSQELAEQLSCSRLIYLLGGFPSFLARSLAGTRCWQSIRRLYQNGGVIAGSSAGAMVLCEHFYDPFEQQIQIGLNLMPGTCVIPHHNAAGSRWIERLKSQLPDAILLGIDEETGLINDVPAGGWTVYGRGRVVLYLKAERRLYAAGKIIDYNDLPAPVRG
ncbi:MAG: Type 1 glutamine amidotransferase-like domain-containing protein, partial [Deltaproteobacteria bacterium]|nr:Type 1 glutamine amidotransferase-like domain-containing protein [Deltaproteobacteria bacterium]